MNPTATATANRATAGGKNCANLAKSSVVFAFALYRARGSRFLEKVDRDRDRDRDPDRDREYILWSKTAIAV